MLFRSFYMQFCQLLRKKLVVLTFLFLFVLTLMNFFQNMERNVETVYISQMYDIVRMLTLSYDSETGLFLMQFYPILVVAMTATACLTDRNTRVRLSIQSRMGSRNYWYGKLLAVFAVTFLVFTLPFFLEMLLSAICFPVSALGTEVSGTMLETDMGFMWGELYQDHRFLTGILWIVFFGGISAVFAVFNFSVTTLPLFRIRILTFFPVYLLIYALGVLESYLKLDYTINYYYILRMCESTKPKNPGVYFLFLAGLLVIAVIP